LFDKSEADRIRADNSKFSFNAISGMPLFCSSREFRGVAIPKKTKKTQKKNKKKPMPILSFLGSVWFGEKPKKPKKNQCQFIIFQKPKTKDPKNPKNPKKNQKNPIKTKKPMPNLRFKGSVWFFGIASPYF
jgi:hypothetical protein